MKYLIFRFEFGQYSGFEFGQYSGTQVVFALVPPLVTLINKYIS